MVLPPDLESKFISSPEFAWGLFPAQINGEHEGTGLIAADLEAEIPCLERKPEAARGGSEIIASGNAVAESELGGRSLPRRGLEDRARRTRASIEVEAGRRGIVPKPKRVEIKVELQAVGRVVEPVPRPVDPSHEEPLLIQGNPEGQIERYLDAFHARLGFHIG